MRRFLDYFPSVPDSALREGVSAELFSNSGPASRGRGVGLLRASLLQRRVVWVAA